MGVTGLWSVLESVGHPVKLDGLEGRRLGVDANLWLYKFIRGFKERDNVTSLENHKLGLFNRISKLLFYKIKPVFVFDGPAPVLKRRTLERRQNVRNKQIEKVQDAAAKLFVEQLKGLYPDAKIGDIKIKLPELRSNNLVAAEKLGDEDRRLFALPPIEVTIGDSDNDSDSSDGATLIAGASSVDIHSKDFDQLPPEVRYEILHDVKESRKRIRGEGLPEDAEGFSNTQLQRLKARRSIQEKIEKCEKEICYTYTGQSFRMQSDSSTFLLLTSNKHQDDEQKQIEERLKLQEQIQLELEQSKQELQQRLQQSHQLKASTSDDQQEQLSLIAPKKLGNGNRKPFILPPIEVPIDDTGSDNVSNLGDGATLIAVASSVDIHSKDSKQLRPEGRHEILHDIKESRKRIRREGLSEDAESVSNFQPQKLKQVEEKLELQEQIQLEREQSKQELQQQSQQPHQLKAAIMDEQLNPVDNEKLGAQDRRLFTSPPIEVTIGDSDSDNDSDLGDGATFITSTSSVDIHSKDSEHSPPEVSCDILPDTKESRKRIRSEGSPEDSESVSDTPSQRLEQVEERLELQEQIQLERKQSQPEREQSKQEFQQQPHQLKAAIIDDQQEQLSQLSTQSLSLSSTSSTARNVVTTKIVEDAKELLRLFGIPYIDAAGEAEAQCALLEKMKLTDGTITDDSDIWLFGAQKVYRNFFSDDKYVMEYKMPDIEFHIRMTRDNLVCFAMLVGSDYTDGIAGVGPVTALEILSEFPGDSMEPLVKFRRWREKYKAPSEKDRIPDNKKREKLLRFNLPDEFPSRTVFDGYLRPMADMSNESFSWGIPELDELREYARRNFAWDQKKTDDKLLPVLKRLNEKRTQPTIDTFFFKTAANRNPELFRSKRVNLALNKIAKSSSTSQQPADEVVLTDEEDED